MLEITELRELFKSNGINLGKENTVALFRLLDEDGSGNLSVDEFKEFLFNDKCRESKVFGEY
jgi:Ca2+-binding EF-hand superfamily protein